MAICAICGCDKLNINHLKLHRISKKAYISKYGSTPALTPAENKHRGRSKKPKKTCNPKMTVLPKLPQLPVGVTGVGGEDRPTKKGVLTAAGVVDLSIGMKRLTNFLRDDLIGADTSRSVARLTAVIESVGTEHLNAVTSIAIMDYIEMLPGILKAVHMLSNELSDPERIKGAKYGELVKALKLMQDQRDKSIRFLERAFSGDRMADALEDDPSILDQSKTLVYVDGRDGLDSDRIPPSPQQREAVVDAAGRIAKIVGVIEARKLQEGKYDATEEESEEEGVGAVGADS